MKLSDAFLKLVKEDEERFYNNQIFCYKQKIYELEEKAEERFLKRPRAEYEEVWYTVNCIMQEMNGMTYEEIKDQYKYCDWLVNVKKRITE